MDCPKALEVVGFPDDPLLEILSRVPSGPCADSSASPRVGVISSPTPSTATEASEDNDDVDYELSIWVLKEGDRQELVPKHTVSFLHLFGEKSCQAGIDYNVIAIHPD
ncbi:hypothetical protein BAE44_0016004, partial [Dichanthelium oligosanthes]